MAIRALIFDLFDTLVDLDWEKFPSTEHRGARLPPSIGALHELVTARCDVSFERFADALVEGARAFAESHFARDREVPTRERFTDLLRRLGVEDAELCRRLSAVHMETFRSCVEVVAHHPAVLDELARNQRLGLCSNFSHSETALCVLEEAGLREHLAPDALLISDAFGLRKPRVEIFREVLERLGVEARESLHVGDSLPADIAGAAAAGMGTVWVTRRVRDAPRALAEYAGPRPDHVIADLGELPELVRSLDGAAR